VLESVKSVALNGFHAITKAAAQKVGELLVVNVRGMRQMDFKKRIADPELYHSMKAEKRFRHVCKFCTRHKRICPVCAGVI